MTVVDNDITGVVALEKAFHSLQFMLEKQLTELEQERARNEQLQTKCNILEEERDKLLKDRNEDREALASQQTEIQSLLNSICALQQQRTVLMNDLGVDMNAKTQVMKMKYESDTLTSRIKGLERELAAQKVEFERMRMQNINLQREISAKRKSSG